jgi:hypothetical protein
MSKTLPVNGYDKGCTRGVENQKRNGGKKKMKIGDKRYGVDGKKIRTGIVVEVPGFGLGVDWGWDHFSGRPAINLNLGYADIKQAEIELERQNREFDVWRKKRNIELKNNEIKRKKLETKQKKCLHKNTYWGKTHEDIEADRYIGGINETLFCAYCGMCLDVEAREVMAWEM